MTTTEPRTASPAKVTRPAAADVVETELLEPVRIISVRIWAVAVAVTVAIATAVVWGTVGTWPQHLSAPAVVMHGTGPQAASATTSGSVRSVEVSAGQLVRRGQSVATVQSGNTLVHVTAPTNGVVVAQLQGPGTAVRAGSPVVAVDPVSSTPTAELVLTRAVDVRRLAARQRVVLDVDGASLLGRIADRTPVRTSAAAVRTQLVVAKSGLPDGNTPVWLVNVTLDPGQRIAGPDSATAVVELPAIPVYRLLVGGGS